MAASMADFGAGLEDVAAGQEAASAALSTVGGFSEAYLANQRMAAEQTARLAQEAGASQEEAAAWLQERLAQIEADGLARRFEAADNYYGALEARMQQWAASNEVTVQRAADATVAMLDSAVDGVGRAVAQVVVYQENAGKVVESLLKSVAAQVIQTLVTLAAQYVISSLIQVKTAGAEMATKVAASAAETYAAAVASTVGVMGPLSLGYAAGMMEAMLAGAAASYGQALGTFAALGQGHEGLQVPRTGSYVLEAGELVVKRDENARLSRFLDAWEERSPARTEAYAERRAEPARVVLRIGERDLAEALVDLARSGRFPVELRAA
jgi:hypothetical protein